MSTSRLAGNPFVSPTYPTDFETPISCVVDVVTEVCCCRFESFGCPLCNAVCCTVSSAKENANNGFLKIILA